MPKLFKSTSAEKVPFVYPTITEVRKGSNTNIVWITGVLLAVVIGILFFIFR